MGSLSRATMVVIGCLVICCLITVGVPQARAVEPGPEAAASARKLQVAGATTAGVQPLATQGEQAAPVESQQNQPATAETKAQVPATAVSQTAPEVPAAPAVEESPAVVQHPPGTPEEELIYAFTDWFIDLFPKANPELGFSLQTNRNYTVAQVDGEYEVRLDPFTLVIDKTDTMELGPVLFRFHPQDKNLLSVGLRIADNAPIKENGKPEAELTIGSQQLSGLWNRNLMNFDKLDLRLTDLAIEDARTTGRLSLGELVAKGGRSEEQGGGWTEKFSGVLKNLAFVEKNMDFGIDSISGQIVATGTNASRFLELKTSLQEGLNRIDKLDMAEIKPLMSDLDEYMRLFSGYASSGKLQNFHFTSEDGAATLASIALVGDVHKEEGSGKFIYTSEGQFNDFTFTEKASKSNQTPVAVTLRKIDLKGDGGMLALPPHLFADIFAAVEGYQQVKKEEADTYAARHGYAFAQKILALIERYSGEISFHDVLVVNAQPAPITLDQATLAAGFDVGDGQGGKIHTLMDFSGFKGVAEGSNTAPRDGRIRLELSRIPSLLHLINDPSALATGNMQSVQGQLMINGMAALMQSGLTLTIRDSFLNFPAAKITLALLAQVEPSAMYSSVGTLNLVMENPEELKRIVQAYSAEPVIGQMLATLTALANRSQEGGKTIDRIDAQLDTSGKVFINAKDVTSMFFPPPSSPGAPPSPAQ